MASESHDEFYVISRGIGPFAKHFIFAQGDIPMMSGRDIENIEKICNLLNHAYSVGFEVGKAATLE
jgi:hypothetical protein